MPPDGVVTVGTQVNVGPIRTGMAEAEAAVRSATENMAAAHTAFGKAAEAGNAQAAAALKLYQTELASAQSALAGLTGAEERETTALRSNISARMAASAELRVLEGNFMGSTRAAGAFLSTLPGIGAAMQIAFPVFGILALVEILGRGVQALISWGGALDQVSEKDKSAHDQIIKNAEDELRHSSLLVKASYDLAIAKTNSPIEKAQLRVQLEAALVGLGEKRVTQLQAEEQRLNAITAQRQAIADGYQQQLQALAGGGTSGMSGAGTVGTAIMGRIAQGRANSANAPGPNGAPSEMQQTRSAIQEAQAAVQEATANQLNAQEKVAKAYDKVGEAGKKAFGDIAIETVRLNQQQQELRIRGTEELTESWDRMYKADMEAAKEDEKRHDEAVRKYIEGENEKQEAVRKRLEAEQRSANEQYESASRSINFNERMNRISPDSATQQRLGAVNQQEAADTGAQQGIVSSNKEQYGDQSPQYQAAQDKLTEIAQKAAAQRLAIVQQDQLKEQQSYQNAFNVIDGGLNHTMDAWLQGTERMSRAWTQFGDNIALAVINGLARAAAAQLVSLATDETVNADKRLDDAKTAAANSYAWASAWGGPVAGAIAAAVAFAGVASFDKGTSLIPRDGMAMLHKGESVLPPPQTDALNNALSGRGGRGRGNGGDNHFHYSPQVSAIDGPSVAGALQQHGQAFMREQNRQLRLMNLIQ